MPGREGPPLGHPSCDVREYYLSFLEDGTMPGFPLSPLWKHVQGWWDVRDLPNVLLVHFSALKADMGSEIRRIAEFLGIEIDESKWPAILEHCSFDYMRNELAKVDLMEQFFKGGGKSFIHKGTNGRWRDVLSPEEIARGDEVAARELTPDCAHWLETGELPA